MAKTSITSTQYLRGFTRFAVIVVSPKWGRFEDPFWARTPEAAVAAAKRKWHDSRVEGVK